MKPWRWMMLALAGQLLMETQLEAAAPPPRIVPDLAALVARPQSELAILVRRYEADRGSLQRTYTIPSSPTRHARLRAFCTSWQAALEKLDATRLSDLAKADLVALRKQVAADREELDQMAAAQAEIAPLVPFASTIITLEEARRRMEKLDAARAAGQVNGLKKRIDEARQAITAGRFTASKTQTNRAAETTARLRGTLRGWFGFYNGYDPLASWWLAEPYREADAALERYTAFLRERAKEAKEETGKKNSTPALPVDSARSDVPDLGDLLALPRSEMRGVVLRYQTERGRQGRRSMVPGLAPSRNPQQVARMKSYHSAWLTELGKIDFGRLSREGQIDYLLLRNHLQRELARLGLPARPPAPRKDGSGIVGRPIGREALLVELAGEMIPYTPEELIAIAQQELAWCEKEMKKASQALGFGTDWQRAVEKVKTLHVEPGKQPEMIRNLAREAIDYLSKHDLVTVPPLAAETWRMEMMSPQRQLVSPFFTGGEVISVSFPTSTMSHEAKLQSMRGNNIHFSRATVHHELIPGHHLQGFMTARYQTHRGLFSTAFWLEGWALYWEMVLYDRGFARTPEDRVGFLFWRMHRCARIIFSLGFHLGKMTPQECIDLLVKRVGHERDNATAEVRRSFTGNYGPLYQAAYLLGGLQFRALRRELVDAGKMDERRFHDAVLRENRIPVALVRASLTGQKLTPDFQSAWKFYGDVSVGK